MKQVYRGLYCNIIIGIVAIPLLLMILNLFTNSVLGQDVFNEPDLFGVLEDIDIPVMSINTLKSGKYQLEFEKYFINHLPMRKIETKIYNQILFSIFNSSDNLNIIVGRDNYLFEKDYPQAYLKEVTAQEEKLLVEKMEALIELKNKLNELGVVLIVRMSPSKAEHYSEYLPLSYKRFVQMKKNDLYSSNWYQIFKNRIKNTDIPFYDRHDLMQDMKNNGYTIFTKGGTHWTLAPMAEYINGLNIYLERLLNKKIGKIIIKNEIDLIGQMGISTDNDIWNICWNALFMKPKYISPNITFSTSPSEFFPNVLNVGQSFSNILLNVIYSNIELPVWNKTYFSWYNNRVFLYSNQDGLSMVDQIAERTEDFELYSNMDVIMIEFLEHSANPQSTQFNFVYNFLDYLKEKEN